MQEIARNVYIETSYPPVTVGAILTGDGWVCIDTPPYPADAQAWRDTLLEISDEPVQYIINTDHHRDRILGNMWLGGRVVAQEASTRAVFDLVNSTFLTQAAEELSTTDSEMAQMGSLRLVLPQISFSQSLQLFCGGDEIEIVHKPSATRGTSWVLHRASHVMFTGDSIVVGQHPHISDGVSKEWLDALRLLRLERHEGWLVVSGRNGLVKRADTEPLSEYLRVARRRIASLCHAGRPRSEVSQLLPEFLEYFPVETPGREQVLRRVKAGLEAIYEEINSRAREHGEEAG